MNLISLIILPARLGYEAARITLDVATGVAGRAARLIGVGGEGDGPAPPERTGPQGTGAPASERGPRRSAVRPKATRSAPSRREGTAPKRAPAQKRTAPAGAAAPARAPAPAPAEPAPVELAAQRKGRQPAPMGSSPGGAGKQTGDEELTHRVETEIFRDESAPSGSVNVNAADGVVWLRGRAESPEQVRELQRRALSVPGVKRLENLLHLQFTAAEPPAEEPRRFEPSDEPLPAEAPDRGSSDDARTTIP